MTADEIAASVAASRAAQGLGPKVTDPATLERIAAVLASGIKDGAVARPRSSRTTTPQIEIGGVRGAPDPDC